MSNYLIGYFSRRKVFHVVEYCDTQEEVDEFLKTHNKSGLVVYAAQQGVQMFEEFLEEFGDYEVIDGLPVRDIPFIDEIEKWFRNRESGLTLRAVDVRQAGVKIGQ